MRVPGISESMTGQFVNMFSLYGRAKKLQRSTYPCNRCLYTTAASISLGFTTGIMSDEGLVMKPLGAGTRLCGLNKLHPPLVQWLRNGVPLKWKDRTNWLVAMAWRRKRQYIATRSGRFPYKLEYKNSQS